ncbi:MAG: ATP-binding cassette domain-containing protein [Pseudomonadota bacterium]
MSVKTPALEIEGLGHSFGARRVLSDVSLTVEQGSFTALLGINGAGKTTLFNLVTRLYDAREGRIVVCGHDIKRAPQAALGRLGVVFQSRALDANLTVAQNFVYQGALHGLSRTEALERGRTLMTRMALGERMGEKVRALSGGQARRAEIAGALLHRPRLLLSDEATAGLDIQARAALVEDMHRLAVEEGVGVLWATHLVDEILPEDRVVALHEGRVVATDTAAALSRGGGLADAFLALTGTAASTVVDAVSRSGR